MNNLLKAGNFQKNALTEIRDGSGSNRSLQEEKMSTKTLLKILVAFGLLAVALLAVQSLIRTSAISPAGGEAREALSAAGSDWIERHPQAAVSANVYAGSDYFERHAPDLAKVSYIGSDWIERHPDALVGQAAYIGSDWIERHPPTVARNAAFAGSDYFERHPVIALNAINYAGSDYAERHPSNRFASSDFGERHPDLPNP